MRIFSEFEKTALSNMVDLQNQGLLCRYNLLRSIDKELEIEEIDSLDIQVVSDITNKNEMKKVLKQLSLLFEYLKSNYYLIDFGRDLDNTVKLNKKTSKTYLLKTDRSYPLESFIFKYNCFYELLISDSIVDLVNHQFKSVEQRRFEIQLKEAAKQYSHTIFWTRASFFVAIIAALVAILSPFCISTKIDKSQHEEIKQLLTGIQSSLQDTIQTIPIDKNKKE